ncbi:MAG: (Fe-S)-binding protein [Bacteroidales bacterium]|nr:(Fe-S)-binding protein [Bacteroidales bacterium]
MSSLNNMVNVFIPCCMDLFVPSAAKATIAVLEKLGDECYYNEGQTCCGRQFFLRGDRDTASKLAYQLTTFFDNECNIVVPSAACAGYIKNYYTQLIDTQAFPKSVKHVTQKTFELCDYIVNEKQVEKLGNSFNAKVFYYESCAARNLYRCGEEVELLLRNTEGLELITDPSMHLCCSANGDFAMHNHEMSEALLKKIVDKIVETKAEYVTCADLHCLQYIDAYIQSHNIDLEAIPLPIILNAAENKNEEEK